VSLSGFQADTYGARVHSNTIILVVDLRAIDDDVAARANVKTICVVTLLVLVALRGINGHVRNGETIAAVDTDDLNRRVLDGNAGNGRVGELVCGEEFGLSLSAVPTFTVPPTSAVTVEDRSLSTLNSDSVSTDVKKRSKDWCTKSVHASQQFLLGDHLPFPFFVAPGCGALEDDSSVVSQTGEVQSSA
jgi:hypothetical protein